MMQRGFSQLPVVSAGRVLGVFSFRSYAVGTAELSLAELTGQRIAPGDLRVDELLEQMQFARVADEIDDLFDAMDRDNGLIVGTADNAVGILTPMDFLRYLHRLSAPFVYLSEIELALRAIIRHAVTPEVLIEVATASLGQHFDPDLPPRVLEEMTFENYATMLGYGATWEHFEAAVGTSRQRLWTLSGAGLWDFPPCLHGAPGDGRVAELVRRGWRQTTADLVLACSGSLAIQSLGPRAWRNW